MTLKSSSNQFWKGEYLINSRGKIIIQKTPTLRFENIKIMGFIVRIGL